MKSGDLVQLCDAWDDRACTVLVGVEDGEQHASNRYIATGTLAVYLKKKKGAPDPAVVILVDGQLGWVWQGEIRSATHSSLTDASMMVPSTAAGP